MAVLSQHRELYSKRCDKLNKPDSRSGYIGSKTVMNAGLKAGDL